MLTDDELIRSYAEVILKNTPSFPVVEALARCRTLLFANEVRHCEVNREEVFETRLAQVAEQLKNAGAEEEVQLGGEEVATSGQKEPEIEKELPREIEVIETETPDGVSLSPSLFYVFSSFCNPTFATQNSFSLSMYCALFLSFRFSDHVFHYFTCRTKVR